MVLTYRGDTLICLIMLRQFGTLEVTNHRTKHKAVLTFKTTDMLHKDLHKVEGFIYDARYSCTPVVLPVTAR